jgi:hypothetical protein
VKRSVRIWGITLVCIWLVASLTSAALADVATGELIDKSNWEKAEGLLTVYIEGIPFPKGTSI